MSHHPPSHVVAQGIIRFLHRTGQPALLGTLSLDVGYSLDRTQQFVDALVASGSLRELSVAEKKALTFDGRASVYALAPGCKPAPDGE